MKRVLGFVLGGAFGLFITWAGLYLFSKLNLSTSSASVGCNDAEHCGPEWVGVAMVAALPLPALACAVTGFVAARGNREAKKTGMWFAGLFALTFVSPLALYLK